MEKDKEEKEYAGYPLKKIEPVSLIFINYYIRLCFARDQNTIYRMVKKRQKDTEYLYQQKERDTVYIRDGLFKRRFAVHCFRICEQMHKIEQAERHNAGQLVDFAQEKCIAEFYSHPIRLGFFDQLFEFVT